MCLTAIMGLAGTVMQAGAASSAARAQEEAANRQLDLQRDIYEEQEERFTPYEETGRRGLAAYEYELGLGDRPEGYEGIPESAAFQTQLGMGRDAIEAGAAGRGGVFSGSTATALERYRTGLASQEVGTYLNRLAALGGQGQAAAGMQGQAGQNYATGASTALANIGDARASGAIGVGNAFAGGLNNMMGIYGYGTNLDPGLSTFGNSALNNKSGLGIFGNAGSNLAMQQGGRRL